MSADNYYLVRNHPLGGYTYVIGFASDVDENDVEIVPEVELRDPQYATKEDALKACLRLDAEYGHDYHPETNLPHPLGSSSS